MLCCTTNPYKNKQCKRCWQRDRYHCTWPNCLRPVLTLTLCRNHYRRINVPCSWSECTRPSYCKQVCAHHYRKREFPEINQCDSCTRPEYMNHKCFYHFTCRTCTQCTRKVFSKQLCHRHYMRQWRRQRLANIGPMINNETSPDVIEQTPVTMNHNPETHSSLKQSDIPY